METIHTIIEIIENLKHSMKVNTDTGLINFWIKKKKLINGNQFTHTITVIDAFWKEVSEANGMNVCDPFIKRFPGHSFVAYDSHYVWSKTMKIVFLTKLGHKPAKGTLPESRKAVYAFGEDISKI